MSATESPLADGLERGQTVGSFGHLRAPERRRPISAQRVTPGADGFNPTARSGEAGSVLGMLARPQAKIGPSGILQADSRTAYRRPTARVFPLEDHRRRQTSHAADVDGVRARVFQRQVNARQFNVCAASPPQLRPRGRLLCGSSRKLRRRSSADGITWVGVPLRAQLRSKRRGTKRAALPTACTSATRGRRFAPRLWPAPLPVSTPAANKLTPRLGARAYFWPAVRFIFPYRRPWALSV